MSQKFIIAFYCPHCGFHFDADVSEYVEVADVIPEEYACPQCNRVAERFIPLK